MTRKESLKRFGAFAQRFPTPPWESHRYAVRWNEVKILGKHTRRSVVKRFEVKIRLFGNTSFF